MNKQEYKKARRIYRDNGYVALKWMPHDVAMEMEQVIYQIRSTDPLTERADIVTYCQEVGIYCSILHTATREFLARRPS